MPIIRKKLIPSEVYPDDIRYNPDTEVVESFVNDEWVENPLADPRTQTTLPPRLTADPRCDAAESVKDALKGQIDGILTAIDGAQSVATIAGLILGLFSFGVFAIFINIALFLAGLMLDAGAAAITAALTPTVYSTFANILYCNMEDDGRLKSGKLGKVQSDIEEQIGGLGAVILNNMVALAGEGGINNLASLGTSTGDCEGFECPTCERIWDFRITGTFPGVDIIWGTEVVGSGVEITHPLPPYNDLFGKVEFYFDEPCTARYLEVTWQFTTGHGSGNYEYATEKDGGGAYIWTAGGSFGMGNGVGSSGAMVFTPDAAPIPRIAMRINLYDGGYQTGGAYMRIVELRNEV